MKHLIIGINGFLGRTIASKLYTKGIDVHGVYNKSTDTVDNRHVQALFHIDKLSDLSSDEYGYVYLCSSFIPYQGMNEPNKVFISTNVDLVSRVADLYWKSRIVFASSVSVYGNSVFNSEKTAFHNPSLYGLSKIAGEFIIKNTPHHAIIRFSSLYGKGMNESTFLPKVIKNAVTSRQISIYGTGSREQDYFHIEDAAELCIKAAFHTENDTFLGVQGKSISNSQVAKLIQSHLPDVKIEHVGNDHSPSFHYDNQYTLQKLNFAPQKNLSTEITALLSYFTNQP